MRYLTEEILEAAQDSEFFPTGQSTFTDEMLTKYASQEMLTRLVPHLMKRRQNFFQATKLVPITSGLGRYPVPERAIGVTFRNLWLLDDASDQNERQKLVKVDSEDVRSRGNGVPSAFELEGDEVILTPTPTIENAALLFSIYRRPNRLVATSSCAKITDIATVGGITTFSVDTDLSVAGGLAVGDQADFLSGKSPFLLWAEDVVITSITSSTIAVAASDVQNAAGSVEPQVGDYICPAQTACIPMLPVEYHPILAELVAWRAIKACGARANLEACSSNIKDLLENIGGLVAQRVETQPDLVMPDNGLLSAMQGGALDAFLR